MYVHQVSENLKTKALEGRSCGSCNLCCKVFEIEELEKPKDVWCSHCEIGVGCKIYDQRPTTCRAFHCGYLAWHFVGPHWRPEKSKIVLFAELEGGRIAARVDAGRPGAWREEPYYSDLKKWARGVEWRGMQVVVYVGPRAVVILPDRDVDLGSVSDDELIVTQKSEGPFGGKWNAFKLHKNDPRAAEVIVPKAP